MKNLKDKFDLLLKSIPTKDSLFTEQKILAAYTKRTLDKLSLIFEIEEQSQFIAQIIAFLKENSIYVNQTAPYFAYTALPRHEITIFLCEICETIAEELNQHLLKEGEIPKNCLQLLMPDVDCKLAKTQSINLAKIINTHILSSDAQRLISLELMSSNVDRLKIMDDEWRRLRQHSDLTQTIHKANEKFDHVLEHSNRLLTHLNTLIKGLDIGKNNEEQQLAICIFKDWYCAGITQDVLAKIPTEVTDQIQQLFTCIIQNEDDDASRQEKFKKIYTLKLTLDRNILISGPALFYSIILSKRNLIDKEAHLYELSKYHFRTALSKQEYQNGFDKTLCSLRILEEFAPFEILVPENLGILQRLNATDLEEVLTRPDMKKALLQQLQDMEGLKEFILGCNTSQIKTVLMMLHKELFSYGFGIKPHKSTCPEEVGVWLQTLKGEYFKLFCEVLADKYSDWSWRPSIWFIRNMDFQHASLVLEIYKEQILGKEISAKGLSATLVYDLDYQSAKAYLDFLVRHGKLQALFRETERSFSTEYDCLTYKLGIAKLGLVVSSLLNTGLFAKIVDCTGAWISLCFDHPPHLRIPIIKEIASQLPKLIRSPHDLNTYLNGHSNRPLIPLEKKIICHALQGGFAKISNALKDWVWIFIQLDAEDCAMICSDLKEKNFTIKPYDIKQLINSSTDEKEQAKRKAIFAAITGQKTEQEISNDFLNRFIKEENDRKKPLELVPIELARHIAKFLPNPKKPLSGLSALASVSRSTCNFFSPSLQARKLLSAIIMGKEAAAEEIVRHHPQVLFERETYAMPLKDTYWSRTYRSEQIYYDITPLKLLFYTGDFKMWDKLLPLIPADMIHGVLVTMKNVRFGGPDFVKIDRDPRTLAFEELKYFNAGKDAAGNTCIYNLLSNTDGIICWEQNQKYRFFYANNKSELVEELHQKLANDEDKVAFTRLQSSLYEMIINCSRRTSDNEHELIQKIFGKKLVRNGIHFEIRGKGINDPNGRHYHNTIDDCHPLINAYRKYLKINIEHIPGTSWDKVDTAWLQVGLAQRYTIPHILQRFLEKNQPFYPLPDFDTLKTRKLERINEYRSEEDGPFGELYPMEFGSGLGFNFGFYKNSRGAGNDGRGAGNYIRLRGPLIADDLAAINQLMQISDSQLKKWEEDFEHKLQSLQSSKQAVGPILRAGTILSFNSRVEM